MKINLDESLSAQSQKFKPEVKVTLVGGMKFFGPGTERLLSLIKENESVRLACNKMEMSYSKAWKMIRIMEAELGYTLVERRQGGKNGGSAHLTERAEIFLRQYRAFERECKETADKLFDKHFK